jgi:cytochrome c biogenesis protein CcmG/thiol:disulfide interchange protein DsbE
MRTVPLFIALFVILNLHQAATASPLVLNQPAPPATLVTLDGQHVSTQSLLGNTIILTFWATWCEPCQRELPLLSQFVASHQNQGLKVLAFSLDEDETLDKVRALAKQFSFPVGLYQGSNASGYGRMWRIPVSFVIDRQGLLRYDGWQDRQPEWTTTRLQKVITPLLATDTATD